LVRRVGNTDLMFPKRQSGLEIVGNFYRASEALLAQSFLESEGIQAWVFDETQIRMQWHLAAALGGVKVAVRPGDAVRAGNFWPRTALRLSRRWRSSNSPRPPKSAALGAARAPYRRLSSENAPSSISCLCRSFSRPGVSSCPCPDRRFIESAVLAVTCGLALKIASLPPNWPVKRMGPGPSAIGATCHDGEGRVGVQDRAAGSPRGQATRRKESGAKLPFSLTEQRFPIRCDSLRGKLPAKRKALSKDRSRGAQLPTARGVINNLSRTGRQKLSRVACGSRSVPAPSGPPVRRAEEGISRDAGLRQVSATGWAVFEFVSCQGAGMHGPKFSCRSYWIAMCRRDGRPRKNRRRDRGSRVTAP
jgi:hypothetical protein